MNICPTCSRQIVEAVGPNGQHLELVKHQGTLWGLRAVKADTLDRQVYGNAAFKAIAYVEHDCQPETLDAPARPVEAPSIGDPVPIGESYTDPEPEKPWYQGLDLDAQERFNDAVSGRVLLLGEPYTTAVKNIETTEDLAMRHWIKTGRGMD